MTVLKENRYEPASQTLRALFRRGGCLPHTASRMERLFTRKDAAPGLPANSFGPRELEALTAYFAWAAWARVANRPGKDYSYTNNLPYDPDAGNRPSSAYLWSAMSLVTLLSGLGFIFFVFGKFDFLGWKADGRRLSF